MHTNNEGYKGIERKSIREMIYIRKYLPIVTDGVFISYIVIDTTKLHTLTIPNSARKSALLHFINNQTSYAMLNILCEVSCSEGGRK